MISIGIDIGKYSIKVAELHTTSKAYSIARLQEFPLSLDPNKDIQIEIIDHLRTFLSQYDHDQCRFVLGIDQSHVSTRRKTFPFRERHKILKSLAFELEDDIPLNPSEVVYDAKISRFLGSTAEIMAVACPKNHVLKVVQLAHDCGFEPNVLSVKGIAFANLFENWWDAPPEFPFEANPAPDSIPARVFLDIGHETTNILVFRENHLLDTRTLDWGAKNVSEAVARKLSLQYVEAVKALPKLGHILMNEKGATADQKKWSDAIKLSIDDLVHSLQLTLLEIKSRYHLEYNSGEMIGGGCQIKNLGPYLTQHLEIPFNRLKHIAAHPYIDFEESPNKEVIFATAMGLAIEGIKKPKNPPINFLKGEFAKQNQNMKKFWEKWTYSLQIGAALLVALFIYSYLRDDFSYSMAEIAREKLGQQAKNLTDLKGSRATPHNIRKFIQTQKRLEANRLAAEELQNINSAMDLLKLVSEVTPGNKVSQIDVSRFLVNNQVVQVEGAALNGKALQNFLTALKSIALGGKVDNLKRASGSQASRQAFSFRFQIDRQGEKP